MNTVMHKSFLHRYNDEVIIEKMEISRAGGQREVAISGAIFSSLALCKDNRPISYGGWESAVQKTKSAGRTLVLRVAQFSLVLRSICSLLTQPSVPYFSEVKLSYIP